MAALPFQTDLESVENCRVARCLVAHHAKRAVIVGSFFSRGGLLLILMGYVGCAQPLRVDTRATVDATGNINVDANANANVKAQLMPTPRLDPVTAMGLPHRPQDPQAAKIAIVDVDGLLLNNDATGL
jgi:hypothetical protein